MVKNLPASAGDVGLIPGSGRSLGGGNGIPLQYSCLHWGKVPRMGEENTPSDKEKRSQVNEEMITNITYSEKSQILDQKWLSF